MDTVTSAPYVRGFVLAYTYGSKRFVGCLSCVRKQLAGEVGMSLLTGWFSITSLLLNPLFILWNAGRLPFLKANPAKVEELMGELGISLEEVDLPRVAAALAAAMVAADGKVEDAEVEAAIAIGGQLIEGFDPMVFHEALENVHTLPPTAQLAGLLAEILEEPGKAAVMRYLLAIAAADGEIADSELAELRTAAEALGVELPEMPADQA